MLPAGQTLVTGQSPSGSPTALRGDVPGTHSGALPVLHFALLIWEMSTCLQGHRHSSSGGRTYCLHQEGTSRRLLGGTARGAAGPGRPRHPRGLWASLPVRSMLMGNVRPETSCCPGRQLWLSWKHQGPVALPEPPDPRESRTCVSANRAAGTACLESGTSYHTQTCTEPHACCLHVRALRRRAVVPSPALPTASPLPAEPTWTTCKCASGATEHREKSKQG